MLCQSACRLEEIERKKGDRIGDVVHGLRMDGDDLLLVSKVIGSSSASNFAW